MRGLVAVTALLAAGCFGTETGNPPAALVLRTSDPTLADLAPGSGAPWIESAVISILSVRPIEGATCDHVGEPHIEHVDGDVAQGVAAGELAAGAFCGFHVELELGSSGHAILVRGEAADGTPFEIASDAAHGIDVLGPGGIVLEEDLAVLLAFDVARWLAAIDLAAVPPGGDGVRRIEPGDAMLPSFDEGFVGSLELFEDPDGDGALGAAEEAAGPIAVSH